MLKLLEFLIAWVVGVTLAISAFAHLANPYAFLDAVMQYGLLPEVLARLVVVFMPWLQLTLAFCLISGLLRLGAWIVALPMFLSFAFAQTYAWFAGLGISCGCFGASDTPIGWFSLSVVYGMLILTVAALFLHRNLAVVLLLVVFLFSAQANAAELTFPPDSGGGIWRYLPLALFLIVAYLVWEMTHDIPLPRRGGGEADGVVFPSSGGELRIRSA